MRILVTGAAGFIGFHVCHKLVSRGDQVCGLDNVNDYYDVNLKHARLQELKPHNGFSFLKSDIADFSALKDCFESFKPDRVVHLAAQAGVRYGSQNPHAYAQSNMVGFLNVLEACRHAQVQHLVFASSSSVYGANTRTPFRTNDNVDHPLSLYAATKKSNELIAHSYAHLYELPVTGLRFFTVYGPWGRPDMSPFLFTKRILEGVPIDVFNNGDHERDFTYIDDIVDGVVRTLDKTAAGNVRWDSNQPDPSTSKAPYRIYNIGNNKPVGLMYYISCIEKATGKKAKMNMLPMQPGDVPKTYADIDDLQADTGFKPSISIEEGVARFVDWYRDFYGSS